MPSMARFLTAGAAAMLFVAHAAAQSAPSLGSAASFAVLGGSAVTNSGGTRISGNVGVTPGNTVQGLPHSALIIGDIFVNDATARQARSDSAAAYGQLAAITQCTDLDHNAAPAPGIYCVTSPPSKTLTLAGSASSVWIFLVKGPLTTLDDSSVLLRGGATYNNVFWQADSSMILGTRSAFVGTILAHGDITLRRDVSMSGRAQSQTGGVTLDTDDISCCDPIEFIPTSLPEGNVGKPYSQAITGTGGVPLYTFSLFDGTLPEGLTLASNGTLSGMPAKEGQSAFTVLVVDAHGCSSIHTYGTTTICDTIVVSFDPTPNPKACVPFRRKISATGGVGRYTFHLPDGLSICEDDENSICGTLNSPGCAPVTIGATDALGCTGSVTVNLCVDCGLTLPSLNPPTATSCVPYNANLTPSCGKAPYVFSAINLPPGLSGPTPAGDIIWTSTVCGTYSFTVTVADAIGCTDTRTYTLTVICPPIVVPQPITLPPGIVCMPYSAGPVAGTAVDPALLPPDLKPIGGNLSGVPKKRGTFHFTMKLDGVSPTPNCPSPTQDYIINIECPPLTLPPLAPLHGCVPMSQSLGPAFCLPFTWSYSGTLPNGLAFNDPGFPGILHGTPQPGDFDFCVTGVASDSGCDVKQCYSGRVATCNVTVCSSPITGLPPSSNLAGGTVAVPYNPALTQTFTATGGTAPYTFVVVVPPSTPPGLSLSMSGVLSSVPTAPGRFNFAVKATDATGTSGCPVVYTIVIGPVPGPPPPPPIPALTPWAMLLIAMALAFIGITLVRRSS